MEARWYLAGMFQFSKRGSIVPSLISFGSRNKFWIEFERPDTPALSAHSVSLSSDFWVTVPELI